MSGTILEIVKALFEGAGTHLIEKWFNKPTKEKSIIINNIHIGDIVNNYYEKSDLVVKYSLLARWLKKEGNILILEKLGESFSKSIIEFIDKLPSNLNNLTTDNINKLKDLAILGDNVLENGETVDNMINELILSIEQQKNEHINNIIENQLLLVSSDLKNIKDKKLEQINIGGLIFIVQTNLQYSKEKIFIPESIGFKKITDKEALVNLAINGNIGINKVILKKGNDKNHHKVILSLSNFQNTIIDFVIEKGQVFENKEYEKNTQNLASSDNLRYSLQPNETKDFQFDAYCLNKGMKIPNGGTGNITIYSLLNKTFRDGDELWKNMDLLKSKYTLSE